MILLLDFFARKCECKTITSAISCALFGYIFISVTLIFLFFASLLQMTMKQIRNTGKMMRKSCQPKNNVEDGKRDMLLNIWNLQIILNIHTYTPTNFLVRSVKESNMRPYCRNRLRIDCWRTYPSDNELYFLVLKKLKKYIFWLTVFIKSIQIT